jgi:NitT/TauT family transport system substrate-binding protein
MSGYPVDIPQRGRLAQLDRALVSGTRGREFKSHIAYQMNSRGWKIFLPLFTLPREAIINCVSNMQVMHAGEHCPRITREQNDAGARMNRLQKLLPLLFVGLLFTASPSQAAQAPLRVGTLAGVSGLAMAKMVTDHNAASRYQFKVHKSPELLTANVIAGEVDLAALPVNSAALLYNKEVPIRLTAVIGWGVMYLVSGDRSLKSWSALKDKDIHVAGKGAVSDLLFRYLTIKNGLEAGRDFRIQYLAPAELAQFAAAGKARYAVLPEPWVTETLQRNPQLMVALDFQEEWKRIERDRLTYPQTVLIASQSLLRNDPSLVTAFEKELEAAIRWLNLNPRQGGALAEKTIQVSAIAVEKGIKRCNLSYLRAADARSQIMTFLERLGTIAPEAIGGKLPDAGFIHQP